MSFSKPLGRRSFRQLGVLIAAFLSLVYLLNSSGRPSVRTHLGAQIQHQFRKSHATAQLERQNAVKREFLHAWTGYQDHSWMADGLKPLTGGRKTQFCSWSATLVDALDTLYIMGLTDQFEEAVNATLSIDFAHTTDSCTVNLFESTIRYLGGMLAAYDLSHDSRLLSKLVQLGDTLLSAFDTANGMPCSHCQLGIGSKKELIVPPNHSSLADVGSLHLEFARLAQITGEEKYMQAANHMINVFARSQNDSSIPGLWPEILDPSSVGVEDSNFARTSFVYSLGALSDSAYEYLVKGHLLRGRETNLYRDMWNLASEQIKSFLIFRAQIPNAQDADILFSGIATLYPGAEAAALEPRTQHLACFAGGMFAMASRLFGNPEDFWIGEQLTNGCVWAYQNSPTGIMPETFTTMTCPQLDGSQCEWNDTIWHEQSVQSNNCVEGDCSKGYQFPRGFLKVLDTKYLLRPEAIESVFILWRMTGDPYWREAGWVMFNSIIEQTRTPFGHAALYSSMDMAEESRWENGKYVSKLRSRQMDDMESFWFAETLKYFYLLFSDTDLINLDEYVLNTEAHPFKLTG